MWLEILLQFLTVFLGAFLAFWLENLRERNQRKTWAKRYLHLYYKALQEQLAQEEENAEQKLPLYQKFIDGEEAMSEEDWNLLSSVTLEADDKQTSLIHSEFLTVLPAELVTTLAEVEKLQIISLEISTLLMNFFQERIFPIILTHTTPLNEAGKFSMRYFKSIAEIRYNNLKTLKKAQKKILELLEQHNYHK